MSALTGKLMGNGDGGRWNVPTPAILDGGQFCPTFIPVGVNFFPSSSPNRGIPRGESGIGPPLPSLVSCECWEGRRPSRRAGRRGRSLPQRRRGKPRRHAGATYCGTGTVGLGSAASQCGDALYRPAVREDGEARVHDVLDFFHVLGIS
jgi:hypothetical protein